MNRDELENDIRSALRARAEQAPGGLPQSRVTPSRRRPSRVLVTAAAVAVLAAAVGLVSSGMGETSLDASDGDPSTTTTANAAASAQSQRHYLAFDIPGFRYTRVGDEHCRAASPDPASSARLDAFGTTYFESPILFVQTIRSYGPDSNFGLVDDEFGDPVTIRGVPGWADSELGRGWTMSAQLPDGDAIYVTVLGMGLDAALQVVNSLERRTDGGWETTGATSGVRRLEPTVPQAGCGYSAQADGFALNLYVDAFDHRLQDRVSSTVGRVEPVTLGSLPAVLGDYRPDDHWVMAEPAPGLTLEIRAGGTRDQLIEFITHARFVDEAGWAAVKPDVDAQGPTGTAVLQTDE
jgi:hypothetical protein